MVLYVDAASRSNSRTRKLAYCLLNNLNDYTKEISLYDKDNYRASDFAEADIIIFAAPHYNLSYPALLHKYLEDITVEGVTYQFEDGKNKGLCKAKELYYITTCGGAIQKPDIAFEHIKRLCAQRFGIENTIYFCAEGLDLEGINADVVLQNKMDEISNLSLGISEPQTSSSSKIMIVDDSKINILKADHILKEYGFETITASSGAECLKELKINNISLILLDIEMPDMNGFETLEEIRKHPESASIPVVFVTADKSMDAVVKAGQYKVAGYVTKPFKEEELINHVRRSLANQKRNG